MSTQHEALLDKFRSKMDKPAAPRVVPLSPPALPQGDPTEYVAFDAKDRVERLRIRMARGESHALAYRNLLEIIRDREDCTRIAIVYTFIVFTITGKNLASVAMALENDTASFLQEFDPKRWNKPTDPNAPFIESIETTHDANEEVTQGVVG
jgi:hypothetical protein